MTGTNETEKQRMSMSEDDKAGIEASFKEPSISARQISNQVVL